MSETDTTTLFVNEASTEAPAGELAKDIGNLEGVTSVELGAPDPETGKGPLMVQRATITFDPRSTSPENLRASLQDLGYTITALSEISE